MWDLIVSVPDHCLSLYLAIKITNQILVKCDTGQKLLS